MVTTPPGEKDWTLVPGDILGRGKTSAKDEGSYIDLSRPGKDDGAHWPWMRRVQVALTRPGDIASLVVIRILVGLILAWEMTRHFQGNSLWYDYVRPLHHFSYVGWEFIVPWPEPWIYVHAVAVGLCGLGLAVGCLYRLTAPLACVGFGIIFLWDQAQYLNHHYLLWLILLLLALLPAHRSLSLDVRWGLVAPANTVPVWCVQLLRLQVACVFIYSGAAKLNADWLTGWPLRDWLARRDHYTLIGPLFHQPWLAPAMAWGGLLYDLLAVPLLAWSRTRVLGVVWSLAFHGLNKLLFSIGIFPVFSLALSTILFPSAWPRRWLRWDRQDAVGHHVPAVPVPVGILLVLFCVWQLLMPLRHWLYPGNVAWTEEGHNYSWRMKLRDKEGQVQFWVMDLRSGKLQPVELADWLTSRQIRKMAGRPQLLLQTAHLIRDHGPFPAPHTAVFAETCVALNQRPCQQLVYRNTDLARISWSLRPAPWIVPLDPSQSPGTG